MVQKFNNAGYVSLAWMEDVERRRRRLERLVSNLMIIGASDDVCRARDELSAEIKTEDDAKAAAARKPERKTFAGMYGSAKEAVDALKEMAWSQDKGYNACMVWYKNKNVQNSIGFTLWQFSVGCDCLEDYGWVEEA